MNRWIDRHSKSDLLVMLRRQLDVSSGNVENALSSGYAESEYQFLLGVEDGLNMLYSMLISEDDDD